MYRRAISRLALGLLFFLVPSIGTAAIFGSDDRHAIPRTAFYADAIGTVRRGSRWGAAFLVSPCHAVASQHVLSENGRTTGKRVRLRIKAAGSGARKATVIEAGQEGNTNLFRDYTHDWALIRLDQCLDGSARFLPLMEVQPRTPRDLPGTPNRFFSIGYPGDYAGLSMDPACGIVSFASTGWLNDCASLPGSSGGPILSSEVDTRGMPIVVAIQSAARPTKIVEIFHWTRANVATPVADIVKALKEHQVRLASYASTAPSRKRQLRG